MLTLEPRVTMPLPNMAAHKVRHGNLLEDVEDILLDESGALSVCFDDGYIELIPAPVLSVWDGDAFAGFVRPRPGIPDAGRFINHAEILRIRTAFEEGRVLTSREVEGALHVARLDLSLCDVEVLTGRLSRVDLTGMDYTAILEIAFGIDRWEETTGPRRLSWYRSADLEVGIGDHGETMTFYRRDNRGAPYEIVTVATGLQAARKAA